MLACNEARAGGCISNIGILWRTLKSQNCLYEDADVGIDLQIWSLVSFQHFYNVGEEYAWKLLK